jgi:hypothetical protein
MARRQTSTTTQGSSTASARDLAWAEEMSALFLPPEIEPQSLGRVSTLHLLRREIIESLVDLGTVGGGMVTEERASELARTSPHRIFASTMVMCTGIDLLGTLSAGDSGAIGIRFQRILRRSAPQRFDELTARRVWGLRNGLMHSFSVRSQSSGVSRRRRAPTIRKAVRSTTNIRARLTSVRIALLSEPLGGQVAFRTRPREWIISVPELYDAFREVVAAAETTLRSLPARERRRVRTMIRRYGQLQVGLQPPRPRGGRRRP